jgi:hypothetical protein
MLQDGGVAGQSWIAADDKDFVPCFDNIAAIATKHILKLYGDDSESLYNEMEYKKLEGAFEDVRTNWLDEVFDTDTKLEADEWRKRVAKNDMIFDPKKIRDAVFEEAGIEKKY